MARIFNDEALLTWEAFSTTGPFSLPDRSRIVFHCLSDPHRRSRYVEGSGDLMDAQRKLREIDEPELRSLLAVALETD